MIDYLLNNVKNNNLYFIFSYDNNSALDNISLKKKIEEWTINKHIFNIELLKLNLEEIGVMVQNILGISYTPSKLASVLFKEVKAILGILNI